MTGLTHILIKRANLRGYTLVDAMVVMLLCIALFGIAEVITRTNRTASRQKKATRYQGDMGCKFIFRRGNNCGWIVANTSQDQLSSAIQSVWPGLEINQTRGALSPQEFFDWYPKTHDEALIDPEMRAAVGFYSSGNKALCITPELTWPFDEKELAELSTIVGPVGSFMLGTSSGTAYFAYYADGKLHRKIENLTDKIKLTGNAIQEESGINFETFGKQEIQQLWESFGLEPSEEPITGIVFKDTSPRPEMITPKLPDHLSNEEKAALTKKLQATYKNSLNRPRPTQEELDAGREKRRKEMKAKIEGMFRARNIKPKRGGDSTIGFNLHQDKD